MDEGMTGKERVVAGPGMVVDRIAGVAGWGGRLKGGWVRG
jgi:hypothetical protein